MVRVALLSLVLLGCEERQYLQECQESSLPSEAIGLSAPPYAQLRREQVRLRFETFELADVDVGLGLPGERCAIVREPERDRVERSFTHPADGTDVPHPDLAGEFTLHSLTFELWSGGEEPLDEDDRMPWTVLAGPDTQDHVAGSLRLPSPDRETLRVAFTANLAPPVQADVFEAAAQVDPDLVVLNGDLRRPSLPEASWSRLMHDLAPASALAVVHAVPGDADLAQVDTYEPLFLRFFGGQGRAGSAETYSSLDLGGTRWIFLDGSDDRLGAAGGLQRAWLDRELGDVAESDVLAQAIIVIHRGPYGLTDQVPQADLRTGLLPYLAERGVRLMVQGDGRLFEHFETEGMVVLTEGGGGAPLGDPDHRLERDPDAAAARVQAIAEHGLTVVETRADGAITWLRYDLQGHEQARGELPAL